MKVQIRLTEEEVTALDRCAELDNRNRSDYARLRLLQAVRKDLEAANQPVPFSRP